MKTHDEMCAAMGMPIGTPMDELLAAQDDRIAAQIFQLGVGYGLLRQSHDALLDAAKLFKKAIEYEIRKSKKAGDEEGVNLKTITLNMVLAAIARAEAIS